MKLTTKRPFSLLAPYYNSIYRRKHYKKEVSIIDKLVKSYTTLSSPTLLDVGVGTGEHLVEFLRRGYKGTGIDLSQEMLQVATVTLKQGRVEAPLIQADARNFQLNKKYDVIVSLFHVLSYQTTNDDVAKFFAHVTSHMKKRGVFIFDCWYGPGVLSIPPEKTKQVYHQGTTTINRWKNPIHHTHSNTVSVRQRYVITKTKDRPLQFAETHIVRYFFYPEIQIYLSAVGLKILSWGKLGYPLSSPKKDAWEVYFVVQKQ